MDMDRKKKMMYIAGTICIVLFVAVLILSLQFPKRSTKYGSTMGGLVIAALCWFEIPTATIPLKHLNFLRNDFKRFFQTISMLPLFRTLLYVVAFFMSTFSLISLVSLFFEFVE